MTHVRDRMMSGRTSSNPISRFAEEIPPELCDREDELPDDAEIRLLRQRPQKMKPVNYFVNETSKPSPALEKKKPATTETFKPGDTVKHASFGVGVVLTVRPMGGDTLYEIAFDKVGTKKLMATYARLTRL